MRAEHYIYLATGRTNAVILVYFLPYVNWSRYFTRISYSVVSCLLVSCSGSVTSVGEERGNFSAIVHLLLCGFCLEGFGAWDRLRYFNVALPGPFIIKTKFLSSKPK